jgi:hypothetical protein
MYYGLPVCTIADVFALSVCFYGWKTGSLVPEILCHSIDCKTLQLLHAGKCEFDIEEVELIAVLGFTALARAPARCNCGLTEYEGDVLISI